VPMTDEMDLAGSSSCCHMMHRDAKYLPKVRFQQ